MLTKVTFDKIENTFVNKSIFHWQKQLPSCFSKKKLILSYKSNFHLTEVACVNKSDFCPYI